MISKKALWTLKTIAAVGAMNLAMSGCDQRVIDAGAGIAARGGHIHECEALADRIMSQNRSGNRAHYVTLCQEGYQAQAELQRVTQYPGCDQVIIGGQTRCYGE